MVHCSANAPYSYITYEQNKSMTLKDILMRGYFPKELPNPFTSASFASVVTSSNTTLPDQYIFNRHKRNNGGLSNSKPAKYSLGRGKLLRRSLSVPNPVNQHALALEIYENWSALQPNIGGTPLSSTQPVLASTGRAIQGAYSQGLRPIASARTRRNNRYILKTDISRFYHSIYTHSIPWAIHTKKVGKADRSFKHLGNRLDSLVRMGQDQQTVGIPIGPDTSLVIAEILMQACDRELLGQFSTIKGHRFIDDYELGFRTRTEAEHAYHILESLLAEYELALNPKKTEIIELPTVLDSLWRGQLSQQEFRQAEQAQRTDLINYFNLSFHLSCQYPDDSVIQYAVARIRTIDIKPGNWSLLCTLLLNCAIPEPACLQYVLAIIVDRVNKGAICPTADLEEALNIIISEHATINHTSEVAWALWACLALGIKIQSESSQKLEGCDNPFVALLALHANSVGIIEGGLNPALWATYMKQESLYDENWLLAYEANIKGWLPSLDGEDYVLEDPNFSLLKELGVSFYDVTAAVPPEPTSLVPSPKVSSSIRTGAGGYF